MRALLTGATGLIGKEAVAPLLDAGFEIYALSSGKRLSAEKITFVQADLLDTIAIEELLKKIRPEYLLHFAWYTGEGYLESPVNYKLKAASLNLLKCFAGSGGRRAVFSGTCFEYAFKSAPLKESDPLNPATIYARCKNELRYQAEVFAQASNLSFGWGRIFYVLGHNEAPNRLLPYIVASLQNGQKAVIKGGSLIRDYMYTKDIAGAFVQFLMSDIKGCVNICSGEGIAIWDLSFKLAEKLGRPDLLEFTDNAQDQPPVIIGDNMRLCTEIGYSLKYDLESALGYICHSTIG